jgi:hypothetical protein
MPTEAHAAANIVDEALCASLRKDVKEVTVVTSGDSPGQWARGLSHEWGRGSVELGEGRRGCAPCGPRSTAGTGGAIAAPEASLD